MRLRTILLGLALLAMLSTAAGGFYYFFSVREYEFAAAKRRAFSRAEMARNHITSFLDENQRNVKALAGLRELSAALQSHDPVVLAEANRVLDLFKDSLEADVCYLMDTSGLVLASSNRAAGDSFVGENFSFRPYFKEAAAGRPGKYLALGTTSFKRGAYFSAPVQAGEGGAVLGVAVIKAPITTLEDRVIGSFEGVTLLTGPHSVIFATNHLPWLFGTLLPQSQEELARVAASRQFGDGPWNWVGIRREENNLALDRKGNNYLIFSMDVNNYPGWKVVHLQTARSVWEAVLGPLAKTAGLVVLGLCLLAGVSAYYLTRKANSEIARRAAAEEGLRLAKEQLSRYSRDLERQVRQRTREITAFLEHTPAVAYMKDVQGRYVMVNSRWEELFGFRGREVYGKTAYDVFASEVADQFRANDQQVLHRKVPYQAEEKFPIGERVYSYLSVRFPIMNESGQVTRLCGISVDITDLKKAQDQLRRLSGSIMAGQEKERAAIARELHDELGQVLTALRMDAVWLRRRLEHDNPQAAARADNMCRLIDKTISDVRHIATRLRPLVLDDLGLADALEWLTTEYEKRTGIVCVFKPGRVPEVDGVTAVTAYRVIQEALTNVARHAKASHVEISLSADDSTLRAEVLDNGRGFDPASLAENKSLGIAGMRERAGLAGGSLEIEARSVRGVRVVLSLPLVAPPAAG